MRQKSADVFAALAMIFLLARRILQAMLGFWFKRRHHQESEKSLGSAEVERQELRSLLHQTETHIIDSLPKERGIFCC